MLKKSSICAALTLCLVAAGSVAAQEEGGKAKGPATLTSVPADVQKHIDAANVLQKQLGYTYVVGQFFNNIRSLGYITPTILPMPSPMSHPARRGLLPIYPPTKVFDQFYYFGNILVGTWALKTNDGIILFDTMSNAWEAEHIVEAGLKAMDLDPKQIKYIILTHGHGDHFGGVPYFTKKYPGIKVASADWGLMAITPASKVKDTNANGPAPVKRPQDIVETDGQKITLGGVTVTNYILPGHTPQSSDLIFDVTDRGVKHTVSLYGGVAFSPNPGPTERDSGIKASDQSLDRLGKLAEANGVDLILSVHPDFTEGSLDFERLALRGPSDPNPFVMGKDGVARYITMLKEISLAYHAIMDDAAAAKKASGK